MCVPQAVLLCMFFTSFVCILGQLSKPYEHIIAPDSKTDILKCISKEEGCHT